MTASIIAQLIIALGPVALELIPKLQSVWTKPTLTPEEIEALIAPAKKSYEQYRAEAAARHAVQP
jgi:hypothetical protein